jgi:hypothetical protein
MFLKFRFWAGDVVRQPPSPRVRPCCKIRVKLALCHRILKYSVNNCEPCDGAKLCGIFDNRILVGICVSGEYAK